jgi:hypothetical protein
MSPGGPAGRARDNSAAESEREPPTKNKAKSGKDRGQLPRSVNPYLGMKTITSRPGHPEGILAFLCSGLLCGGLLTSERETQKQ